MTQPVQGQNQAILGFSGQFPLTAPDLAVSGSPSNPSAGGIIDIDSLATETISELQNLQQDLMNRLTETPGSNLDFGVPNSRGVGLMLYLNSTQKIGGLPARIDAEFIQDPRVTGSVTTLAKQPDGSYLISSQVTTVAGVFGLGWSWSQAGVAPVPV
jgi:hypothetical protein